VAETMSLVREGELDLDFLNIVESFSGGEKARACIQCGTCSGSCPFSARMQYTPRKIMEMIRAGMKEKVLASDTIWYCASCYSCAVRCPQGINLPEVMYALRRMAMSGVKSKSVVFYDCFNHVLRSYGRIYENGIILRLALKTAPLSLVAYGPLGVKMFLRGRLSLFPNRIKALNEIKTLYSTVMEMEGGS